MVASLSVMAQTKPYGKEGHERGKMMETLDTDKDNKLSMTEVKADNKQRLIDNFDKIDHDKDGYITQQELQVMRKKRKRKY